MEENKEEEIFNLLRELPLERWEIATNSGGNYTTIVDGTEVYLRFWQMDGLLIYIGESDEFYIRIDNSEVVRKFRSKLIDYFEGKKNKDKVSEIDRIYNSLKNSVCQSSNR